MVEGGYHSFSFSFLVVDFSFVSLRMNGMELARPYNMAVALFSLLDALIESCFSSPFSIKMYITTSFAQVRWKLGSSLVEETLVRKIETKPFVESHIRSQRRPSEIFQRNASVHRTI
jgi:hypothetical protein